MEHLPQFISDLGLILITAGVVTIIFKWLKQPVVLGYIVAGFLASPKFIFFPSIGDAENINTWGEIGVIFLLFALGLEFSFKKLISVGGSASIATLVNLGSMVAIGYLAGDLMGWSSMNSIFLGGMLSMSSTTIIIKAFNDMGLQKKKFAHVVFGMLVVEDLAAILMMVLLSTFAVSRHFEGGELFSSMLKLVFFMLIWFIVGIYMIPTMLKKLKLYLNSETLLIVSTALCLGMVMFATSVKFSAALGAFVMGSILAETVEVKRVEHLMEPLKNFFGAVFFVSVGMRLDSSMLIEHIWVILILTVVVLVGRVIFATIGVLASGHSLQVAVESGLSLAQIGEFSFIIATLGVSLKVIDDFLYPIIVAVSIITTFTTPYFINASSMVYGFLEKRIPHKWDRLLKGYASAGYSTTVNRQSDWNTLLKQVLRLIAIYSCLCLAVIFLSSEFLKPAILAHTPSFLGSLVIAVVTILAISPFMRAMIMRKNKSPEFKRLWTDSRLNRSGLLMLISFRVLICVVMVLAVLVPLFPQATALLFIISMLVVSGVIYSQVIKRHSRRIEQRFLENLHLKEVLEEQNASVNKKLVKDLLDKDLHVEEIEIAQNSAVIGKTLRELNFKQTVGVNIVSIVRGAEKINIPDGNEHLYPFDRIVVVGSDDEIQECLKRVAEYHASQETPAMPHIMLSQYIVEARVPLDGKTIRDLNSREIAECMIIGIDRKGHSINFAADMQLENGDVLWLAGEQEAVEAFGKVYAQRFATA